MSEHEHVKAVRVLLDAAVQGERLDNDVYTIFDGRIEPAHSDKLSKLLVGLACMASIDDKSWVKLLQSYVNARPVTSIFARPRLVLV